MNQYQRVTVYTPESGLRKPGKLIKELVCDLINSRELAWRLFMRNFRAMYRQSLLGLLWAFVPPLMTALVWVFLNGQRIVNIDDPGVPYPAFVLTSVLLWSVFAQALLSPIQAIVQGRSIMVKINFPREALILAGILQVITDFLIKFLLIAVVLLLFQVPPATTAFFFPAGVIVLMLLGLSLGLILLPVGMLYTDVQRFLNAIVPFWMLLTPVIYPTPRSGLASTLNQFNPVAPVLSATRDWIFTGSSSHTIGFLWVGILAMLVFFVGLILFRVAVPIIIEKIGS